MRYCRLPSVTLEPFDAMVSNVQAHLSAFSAPRVSYQAFRSGSLVASSFSCAMIEAMPSAPTLPFGDGVPLVQALGQRAGLPMKAYLMSRPPMVACVCQPQYWVQKPEVSLTSCEVSTMYTVLVSVGLMRATMACTPASPNEVPCE